MDPLTRSTSSSSILWRVFLLVASLTATRAGSWASCVSHNWQSWCRMSSSYLVSRFSILPDIMMVIILLSCNSQPIFWKCSFNRILINTEFYCGYNFSLHASKQNISEIMQCNNLIQIQTETYKIHTIVPLLVLGYQSSNLLFLKVPSADVTLKPET